MFIHITPFRQFLEHNSTSKLFTIQMKLLLAAEHRWKGKLPIAASRPKTIKTQITISLVWESSVFKEYISIYNDLLKIHSP